MSPLVRHFLSPCGRPSGSPNSVLGLTPIRIRQKTLKELQQDLSALDGCNIHHIVEQTSARKDGYPDSVIDRPDNLVRIPTLTHWLISAWFSRQNNNFGGLSPRDYLRGKSWDERMRIGKEALILFGVLQP
jgi:hypothetical protein